MKKMLLLIITMLSYNFTSAQTIVATEYFFDSDPGVGNGNAITVDANSGNVLQTSSIATDGLSEGFHSLYVRSRTINGQWSLYDRTIFLIRSFSEVTQSISKAEYFFDADPGVGNGTSLALNTNTGTLKSEFTIPLTGLGPGFHSFYMRTQNAEGAWSLYDRTIFFIGAIADKNEPIAFAEYFFDTDPGLGKGTEIALDTDDQNFQHPLLLPTTDLAIGAHTVYIRVRTANGTWGLYDQKNFNISSDGIDNSITVNDLTLTANFNNTAAIYQWFDCINDTIFGTATSGRSFTPLISGSYAVRITLGQETVISPCTEVTVLKNPNDDDGDGILNEVDNCPFTFNTDQTDADNNGIGDICENDTDNDGVNDEVDSCPQTPVGAVVDLNGCEIFSLPADNFIVKTVGESCIASNDGSIAISTENAMGYVATLSGNSGNIINNFTDSTSFENLSADDYDLCITVEGQSDYELCFNVTIQEPEALSVASKLSITGKEITLNMSGAQRYAVALNGQTYHTDRSEITLPLTEAVNSLSVFTDKGCQGTYEEHIVLASDAIVYPNPVSDEPLTVVMGTPLKNESIEASIFNPEGVLEFAKRFKTATGTISIDVSNLTTGVHFLHLRSGSRWSNYKIVKR
ncbi:thrombospondin type 3 repeat-containing protein [Pareuzebyella sediminis]|uniref:thrombospondin type 3 repeat-containing protein n=1 Tax=Pareuzebyella sediminis TaxID=2607998 RepID=UPI0011EBFF5B|nr:thrombospondin type 3 repeat-containing protein [Pareuzebyella sediminis]